MAWSGPDTGKDVAIHRAKRRGRHPDTDHVTEKRSPEFSERNRVSEAVRRTWPPAALPGPPSFLARQPYTRSGREGEKDVFSLLPNFRTKFQRWEGGENSMLRGEIRVKYRTPQRTLRNPGLTFQLPYAPSTGGRLPPPARAPRAGRSLGVML